MPPKNQVARSAPRKAKGYVGATYDTLTAPENQAIVRSIAAFGVGVAFLVSPWAEYLLPPP